MNSAEYVANLITDLKNKGCVLSDVAWQAALACVGWAYVFGALGQDCTPSYRRTAYASHGSDHPTIKTACKNFDGNGSCSGCKWYPNGKRTKVFDCRGFTRWIFLQVYGWTLEGAGATSQWNTESNWTAKGTIDTMPKDTLCCLFVKKDNKMSHTGFGYNNETIECSSGVQHFTSRNKKWTHWAVAKCVTGDVPTPEPVPVPTGYAIVTGKRVALRKAPTTQASIIMRIDTGKQVKLETPPPQEWDYVSYQGKTGWMMKEFLKEG